MRWSLGTVVERVFVVVLLVLHLHHVSASKFPKKDMWSIKCTDVPQYDALQAAAVSFKTETKLHLRHLCNITNRNQGLTAKHIVPGGRKIILDYSRQQVTGETMELLFDLADAVRFIDRRAAMRSGVPINTTERRPVLHHVLRMPKGYQFLAVDPLDGDELLKEVHSVREQIEEFTEKVRSGDYVGVSGKPLKNYICIGIGGSYLGTEFVFEALRADDDASEKARGRKLRFIANVDPVDFELCTRDLDPEETLVIVISKTFTTAETMLNARTARWWLTNALGGGYDPKDIIGKHFCAISTNVPACVSFGVQESRVFKMWEFVGGRFSVCSAVGILPLSLQYSYNIMTEFLDGAHDLDQHFFDAPLRDNIPLLLGLLGVWNSTFLGYHSRVIVPYSQALKRFAAHIQQVDMESNGKSVAVDGTPVFHSTGEVNFGEPGTNCQHSFFQMLHQGSVIPADFIGFIESQSPVKLDREPVSNHDELMSNFFAQPDALAFGKSLSDLAQEGIPEWQREHRVLPGNRPSSSILMTKLDAFGVGQLLAMYEHRTVVQGFIWGINSFDQWGVELGKALARGIRTQLSTSRKTGASVQGFNSSTSKLLEVYLGMAK